MIEKHFHPYAELIVNCITSSTTNNHLHCCADMMFRFKEHFQRTAPSFTDVWENIDSEYKQKQMEING